MEKTWYYYNIRLFMMQIESWLLMPSLVLSCIWEKFKTILSNNNVIFIVVCKTEHEWEGVGEGEPRHKTLLHAALCSGGSRISQRGCAKNRWEGGRQPIIWPIFRNTAWKWRNFLPDHAPCARPLDPPLAWIYVCMFFFLFEKRKHTILGTTDGETE